MVANSVESLENVLIAPARRPIAGPLVFLAGPTWTWPWQDAAIDVFSRLAPDLILANPRRPLDPTRDFSPAMYAEQVDWETEHLRRAGACGAVMFYLAAERDHRCDRAYAQTTRFELGEWLAWHHLVGAPVAIGIEDGFTGARYIRRRVSQDCPTLVVHSDLESTCRAAIAAARASAQ